MSNIATALSRAEDRFLSVAPSYIKFDSERGFVAQMLRNDAYLASAAESNPQSLEAAIVNVAAIGLSLNPAEKLAYLITRNVKIGDNRWESRVFLEPSYAGLIMLATNSGSIEWVQARCVYENDSFVDNGIGEKPTHKYDAFKDRGDFIGCYCVAKTKEGDFLTTLMSQEQIYSIRDRSEAWKRKKAGPWKTDFEEMAKKSVIRNAFKTWPRSNERQLALAVQLSNENEGFEPIISTPNMTYSAEQKEYFDSLITNDDALGIYVFLRTIPETVSSALYNSFEKGSITRMKQIVSKLNERGAHAFAEYTDIITTGVETNDPAMLDEALSELDRDAIELIKQSLNPEILIQLTRWQDETDAS